MAGALPPQALHDHATFTPAELDRYGLPAEAALGLPHDEWVLLVRNAQFRVCDAQNTYQDGHPLHASMLASQHRARASRALDTCINFCGLDATPPATNCPGTSVFICVDRHVNPATGEVAWMGFGTSSYVCPWGGCLPLTEVTSYWHVPSVANNSDAFDDATEWVGAGGVNGNSTGCGDDLHPSLVQVGTDSGHVGSATVPTYSAWFENCGATDSALLTIDTSTHPVHAGELMLATAGSSTSSTPGAIYIQDVTTGWVYSLPNGVPHELGIWNGPDGNSAECVVEARAFTSPVWKGLADFGNPGVHWEFCRVWTNYNTASINGIGSMPGDTLLNFRNYVVNGSEAYCASTQWWDSFDPTYGYTSYYLHSVISTTPECVNGPG